MQVIRKSSDQLENNNSNNNAAMKRKLLERNRIYPNRSTKQCHKNHSCQIQNSQDETK